MKKTRKLLKEEVYDPNWIKQFQSPIPKHLSPEEKAQWEKELAWEQEEIKRRKKEGYYPYQFHDLN